VASAVESDILPARVSDYDPGQLDTLLAAGEVAWAGIEPLGDRDGRVALYLPDRLPVLRRPRAGRRALSPMEQAIVGLLEREGASFFAEIHAACGGGFPGEVVDALWGLVWRGLATSDAFHALRHYLRPDVRRRRPAAATTTGGGQPFRSRRTVPPAAEGRWWLADPAHAPRESDTAWSAAVAQQLLARYGIVSREVAAAEGLEGGFGAVYEVLRSMEERGRIRRGYFIAGVGAAQFAVPAAIDLLRSLRRDPEEPEVVHLAATDPANPYGSIIDWPSGAAGDAAGRGPTRSAGARVVLVDGRLAAWIPRTRQGLIALLPDAEPDRGRVGRAVARELAALALTGEGRDGGLLVGEINGLPAEDHPLAPYLRQAGFLTSPLGYYRQRERTPATRESQA
jgi:ATP-dependent Lhr-like helicase